MAEQEATATPEATQQETKPATQPAGASNTELPSLEQTVPYSRFKEINDKLKALEDDAAKRTKEQQAADEKRLAEAQEWQKLADKRRAQVEELEPRAALADKLADLVLQQYAAEIKDWPEQVKAMAPAEDAGVLAKLDWMQRAKPLAYELMGDKQPVGGNGRRPKPAGPVKQERKVEPIYDVRRNF